MTDTERIRDIIKNSGLKYKTIASKLGLTYYGLQKKLDNKSEFKASEIKQLCEILSIKDMDVFEIFFNENVDLKST